MLIVGRVFPCCALRGLIFLLSEIACIETCLAIGRLCAGLLPCMPMGFERLDEKGKGGQEYRAKGLGCVLAGSLAPLFEERTGINRER